MRPWAGRSIHIHAAVISGGRFSIIFGLEDVMNKSRIRLGTIFFCTVLLCTLALAADQKSPTKLSDLPPEAQQAISTALARELPGVPHFTLTASDGADGDIFGGSVAISGNTVVVGAAGSGNQEKGAVYVF